MKASEEAKMISRKIIAEDALQIDEECTDYEFEPVFHLGRALYVPHYGAPHMWVSYGGETKTTVELVSLGAKPSFQYLWKRYWTEKEIFKGHPRECSKEELLKLLTTKDAAKAKSINTKPRSKPNVSKR